MVHCCCCCFVVFRHFDGMPAGPRPVTGYIYIGDVVPVHGERMVEEMDHVRWCSILMVSQLHAPLADVSICRGHRQAEAHGR